MAFYIAYTEGYQEPIPLDGPYDSYDEAIDAHFQHVLDSLGDDDVSESDRASMHEVGAHQFYLEDDAVRIAETQFPARKP